MEPSIDMNDLPERPVRSFVRREGRMTEAQKRALEELWPIYGIDADPGLMGKLPPTDNGELTLEIGFGDGDTLLTLAKNNPEHCFIGIDPHRPGAGRLLLRLERENVRNVRLVIGDAAELVPTIDPGSLSQILVLFPDPWPKKRHHKRRLITPEFLHIVGERLQPDGTCTLLPTGTSMPRRSSMPLMQHPSFVIKPANSHMLSARTGVP